MKLFALLAATIATLSAASAAKVDSDINSAISRGDNPDIIVHLPAYQGGVKIAQHLSRSEKRVLAREVRLEHNKKYQEKVIQVLEDLGVEFRPLWIINGIIVKGVNAQVVSALQNLPEVISLEADKEIARIHEPIVHKVELIPDKRALEWGIEMINAPSVWNQTQGEGVTIANIDTGVRYTHEAVIASYRGSIGNGQYDHDYNWFDARGQTVPYDNNGHGTHTMGTIAGSEKTGIGVAPGAKWIAARGCSTSCATADLLLCGEYVICPTKVDGTATDCTKGADVVSNSWGGGSSSTIFLEMITTWIDAGSVPIFSQGNSGPFCDTVNSPGDLAIVIGVGATNSDDALASFSSRGPAADKAPNFVPQKPDISAPGEKVRSSFYNYDTAYSVLSGTSMAAPHVAGLVGLLLSAFPRLTYDEIRQILQESSNTDLQPPKGIGSDTCDGVSYDTYPNYHYGYGRIDAEAAFELANLKYKGK